MKYLMLVCRDGAVELPAEETALNLARTEAERRYLTRRLAEVSTGPAPAEAEGA